MFHPLTGKLSAIGAKMAPAVSRTLHSTVPTIRLMSFLWRFSIYLEEKEATPSLTSVM